MAELGLLQAIGVRPDGMLIWGERRLRAAKLLGWNEIPVTVMIEAVERGEFAENTARKHFKCCRKKRWRLSARWRLSRRQRRRYGCSRQTPGRGEGAGHWCTRIASSSGPRTTLTCATPSRCWMHGASRIGRSRLGRRTRWARATGCAGRLSIADGRRGKPALMLTNQTTLLCGDNRTDALATQLHCQLLDVGAHGPTAGGDRHDGQNPGRRRQRRHARLLVAAALRSLSGRISGRRCAALEAVQRRPPDVIVSDVMMPGLDGFQLLAALRGDDATRTIPFILLSARAGEEARIDGLHAGADDYLVKPFSARELIARVDAQLVRANCDRWKKRRR